MALGFDSMGREIPDPKPVELAPGAARPESLQSMMQRLIREHLSVAAEQAGEETFEEANDFDVGDDEWDDQLTRYEEMADENDTRSEVEERTAPGGDSGSSEPPGLRAGGTGPSPGTGGPEAGNVDGEPDDGPPPALPAAAREANLVVQQPRATVHRRRSNAES